MSVSIVIRRFTQSLSSHLTRPSHFVYPFQAAVQACRGGGGRGGSFSGPHDVWGPHHRSWNIFSICLRAKLAIWIALTSVVIYCATIFQQIWLFLGWMDVSCVWFRVLAVKVFYYWCTVSISLPCMMQPLRSSHLPSSSWRKMAGCFSRNEAVIGPRKNGFLGRAVALDGPAAVFFRRKLTEM